MCCGSCAPSTWSSCQATNNPPTATVLCASLFPEHPVSFCFELVAWFPFRKLICLGDPVADREQHRQILSGAAQIPVCFHLVRWLVVIMLGVIVAHLPAVIRRLADKIDAFLWIQCGDALLRKVEMIGSIVKPFLRLGVSPDHSALLGSRVTG